MRSHQISKKLFIFVIIFSVCQSFAQSLTLREFYQLWRETVGQRLEQAMELEAKRREKLPSAAYPPMNQNALAKALNVSRQQVSNLIQGKVGMSLLTGLKAAQTLNTSVSYLLAVDLIRTFVVTQDDLDTINRRHMRLSEIVNFALLSELPRSGRKSDSIGKVSCQNVLNALTDKQLLKQLSDRGFRLKK